MKFGTHGKLKFHSLLPFTLCVFVQTAHILQVSLLIICITSHISPVQWQLLYIDPTQTFIYPVSTVTWPRWEV